MPRYVALLLIALAGLPTSTFAQFPPAAGSAGGGNSAISGVPYGPANPRVIGDPSGIGNASRIPPLGTNAPAPPPSYGALTSSPTPRAVATPSYVGTSRRIISARPPKPKTPPLRGRGGPEVSTSKNPTNDQGENADLLAIENRRLDAKINGVCRGC